MYNVLSLLLLLVACYAHALLVPSQYTRACSAESTVFCNRDFKISDLQRSKDDSLRNVCFMLEQRMR